MTEPTAVGIEAQWDRLSALAPDGVKVLRGNSDHAADPKIRGRDPEWAVMVEGQGVLFRSADAHAVAAFLEALRKRQPNGRRHTYNGHGFARPIRHRCETNGDRGRYMLGE